jgi:hypothetical protein
MIGGHVQGSRLAVFRLACWLIEFGIEIPMKCGNGGTTTQATAEVD